MIKSPDVPRLYKTGTLIAGDFKILDVHLEDWLKPLAWLLEMYDYEVSPRRAKPVVYEPVDHKQAVRLAQGD